ncbi:hypothetical protein N8I71_16485 [Roseibacterium sp. SDUM158016]|uniref:hypothetical protein n=1 Tax=Roseicyclus sediminis TaxID=2980997 RepID=UPI0021D040FD|nr:hypothetical protein [Roseibacterium sp. SDUM158016]MCU4654439.1 hypothetical protein [Roseibacterium sp. SDUM158016]
MSGRRAMSPGHWLKNTVNVVVGPFLGMAAHGRAGRAHSSGVRAARIEPKTDAKPRARVPGLPLGFVSGMVAACLWPSDPNLAGLSL